MKTTNNNQFQAVNTELKQTLKNGTIVEVKQPTKRAIINQAGRVIAYIPDFAAAGTEAALLAILNAERKVFIPEQ